MFYFLFRRFHDSLTQIYFLTHFSVNNTTKQLLVELIHMVVVQLECHTPLSVPTDYLFAVALVVEDVSCTGT